MPQAVLPCYIRPAQRGGEIRRRSGLLPLAELKHNAARVTDIVLMAAESSGAVDLRHYVFDLNRVQRDTLCQIVVQTTTGGGCEGILSYRDPSWAIPHVGAAEKELRIGRQT
jgi:hypothetical protein